MNEQVLARHYLYSFFSSAFSDPLRKRFALSLREQTQTAAAASANLLSAEIDISRVVNYLRFSREEIAAQYQNCFGLTSGTKLSLHEIDHCRTRDTTYTSQQLADIAGFYEAFQFETNAFGDAPERPDHLVVELDFMGFLAAKEAFANSEEKILLCRDAGRNFFSAHLRWVSAFAAAVKNEDASGLYAALADSLANFVAREQTFFGLAASSQATAAYSYSCPDAPSAECGGCPLYS